MSKSRQTISALGAAASPSGSTQKEIDNERRFIDDLMTRQFELPTQSNAAGFAGLVWTVLLKPTGIFIALGVRADRKSRILLLK